MKRLISKFIVLTLLAAVLPCSAASTEIKVEGEAYKSATFNVTTESGSEFSGGTFVSYLQFPIIGNAYKITYEFEAAKEGTYALEFRCSDLDKTWTTDFSFSVNGGNMIDINDVSEKTADFKNSKYPSLIKEYSAGTYDLNEGVNTLTITLHKDDIRSQHDGKIGFWLDYFSFSKMDFGFKEFVPVKDCGVFERDTRIQYKLDFYAKADKNYIYDYKITDFWGRTADSGTLELPAGKKNLLANFGVFNIGWYKVELFKQGDTTLISYANFSVVPKLSERYMGETPFAMDFASFMLVKKEADFKKLLTAAELAGIGYVRERAGWTTFGKNGQTQWDTMITNHMKEIKEKGMSITQILTTQQLWQQEADSFTDLFRAYDFQKKLVKNTGEYIDLIEIDNELDGATSKIPADIYAAYLKAMFIANADSGGNMLMSMVSLCLALDSNFNDGLRRNDALNFTDIYNFHAHTTYTEKNKVLGIRENYINENVEAKMSSNKRDIPNWLTEAGMYLDLGTNAELTDEQQKIQARYLSTATVEALSCGVDKFFWFVWPKFVEHNKELGTFDAKLNPNPAYQAEAICSYILGKAKYKGAIDDKHVEGHVFDNGKNDVMVLWTDTPQKYIIKTDSPVTVTDIMGQSNTVLPEEGKVSVEVAYYPVYVSFESAVDASNYYAKEFDCDKQLKRSFTSGERIILQQVFDNQDLGDARNKGYEISRDETYKMVLSVNNFNNDIKTVNLKGELEGYTIKFEKDSVTVPAMRKTDVNVELIPTNVRQFAGIDDIKMYLKFTAETDGEVSSPSVSTVRIINNLTIVPNFLMDGAEDIKSFDITNVAADADTEASEQEDGSYRFDSVFNKTNGCWYYPKLEVKDVKKLTQSDGIVFWIKGDKTCENMGDFKSFVNFTDGRRYFTGNAQKYLCKSEWVQVKIPWEDFILFSSPYGDVDLREFDPALIGSIEIGGNFYPDEKDRKIMFYVKDPGFFINEKDDSYDNNKIIFEGIESGLKYDKTDLSDVKVILPKSSSDVLVMLTDCYTDRYTETEEGISIDLSSLIRGKYTLRVMVRDEFGYIISDKVEFYIN